ncbi:hypothetical protein PENANT_c003G02306 [Penicillium antarcticum]|uniref:Myb-like domain-containing protein n=1 Tax=Penicillium antarcticum TaxID=416450 RepID=A0A1V6QJ22_9EURO|nr:hypothetical protein PENANT_c003G02306 [Penicillium antarcticum]
MVGMLAIAGVPKLWVSSPEYCSGLPSIISDSSPSLSGSPKYLDEHSLSLSSDWHSNTCSSEPSPHPNFRFLHHLPTNQTQYLPEAMLSPRSLAAHAVPYQNSIYSMLHRVGDQYGTEYAQNVSPCMARPDIRRSIPNNNNGYCESYSGTLENYDETFNAHRVGSHAGLVHPIPRNSHMAANNLSFLSATEDTPSIASFDVPNEQKGCAIPNQQSAYVPSMTGYNTNQSDFNFHTHKAHMDLHTSPYTKFTSSENGPACSSWSMNTEPDMWYHSRVTSDAADDMTWLTASTYEGPWSVNHPYRHAKQTSISVVTTHGLPMPPFDHIVMSGTTSSFTQESFASVPRPTVIQVPQNQQPFPDNGYASSSGAVYSDTEAGSFDQLPLNGPSPSYVHPTTEESASPQPASDDRATIEASLHYSDARNAFLIDCKRHGLSYKDIKRIGGFKEAESTLRGRFRTLTKAKDQRVRKPKWQTKDIKLLREAVFVCSESPEAYTSIVQLSINMHQPPKVSWKKVAEYIWSHGGSYYFGNATCKKKWCEIHDIKL